MKIQVLALEGVFDTGVSALLDTFAVANDLHPASIDSSVLAAGTRRSPVA
jgi:hypothetical protein